jgi:hypothetical protein
MAIHDDKLKTMNPGELAILRVTLVMLSHSAFARKTASIWPRRTRSSANKQARETKAARRELLESAARRMSGVRFD